MAQLARVIRDTVRANPLLSRVLVRGEVSNLQAAPAGHVFFTLKDATAQVSCVLFREDAVALGFDLEDGMDVVASGDVDLFPRKGTVQLLVRAATPAGVGAFWAAYQKTRRKLASEGLFDVSRKRPLPRSPTRIGVVTSEVGAVVHDIVSILRRRFPLAHVVIAPALVQGPEAPASLRRALAWVADRVDVVIVARGGGSLEDLWCFNDEGLARAVASCRVPVVSAVGHETDVTIVDFVADVRAATPSAAAELVSPDVEELLARANVAGRTLRRGVLDAVAQARRRTRDLGERLSPRGLRREVEASRIRLDRAAGLPLLARREIARHANGLKTLGQRLDALSPLGTLRRGYAIAERPGGAIVVRAGEVAPGDALDVRLQDGRLKVHVERKEVR
ncbi:MAG: exodeoxyribonuclease VII large subunit [Methanobacteriota archaeon]